MNEHVLLSPTALVVDMDGSLLATDILVEGFLRLALRHPLKALRAVGILFSKGRVSFKDFVFAHAGLDLQKLPVRPEVLALIEDHGQRSGGPVILASASPHQAVLQIGEVVGKFDHAVGSTTVNLKGAKKLTEIQRLCPKGFDYVGDSSCDLAIWSKARTAYVIGSAELEAKCKKVNPNTKILASPSGGIKVWIKALRVHHWVKNLLVFAAPFAAHRISDAQVWLNSLAVFAAFSFTASAVYLGNDLADLDSDRAHPKKRQRPLAAGKISISQGLLGVIVLITLATLAAFQTLDPGKTALYLGAYLAINLGYSLRFKAVYGLDIVILSLLYTLRVAAGADINHIPLTSWFNSFFVFVFLSLACLKRYTELRMIESAEQTRKGYKKQDADVIREIGVGASLGSIFIFVLYLGTPEVKALYQHVQYLWLLVPLMAVFFTRLWISAGRDMVSDDPVVYVMKDRTFYILVALALIVLGSSL